MKHTVQSTSPRPAETIGTAGLVGVFLLLAIYVTGNFLATDIVNESDSVQLPYFGHLVKLLMFTLVGFLCLRSRWLLAPSALTYLMLGWLGLIAVTCLAWEMDETIRTHLETKVIPAAIGPLVYLLCYVLTRRRASSVSLLVYYFWALFVWCSALFIYADSIANDSRLPTIPNSGGLHFEQLNQIYYPLLLLPWLYLARSWLMHIIAALAVGILVFMSLKRGALCAFAASTISFFYARQRSNPALWKANLVLLVGFLGLAFLAFGAINQARDDQFARRLTSILDDQGSGRYDVYADTWSMVEKAAWAKIALGHGHNTVVYNSSLGLSAHNDWLEVIYDYGVFGFGLYVLLHLLLLRRSYQLFVTRSMYFSPFVGAYALFFVMSAISHVFIYPWYFIFLTAFWGAVEGVTSDRRTKSGAVTRDLSSNDSLGEASAG